MDDFLRKYWELDTLYDKMVGVNTYNMNLEDNIACHKGMVAFAIVAFVVDNDDDENGLVQNLFQLIH